jgi:hypothetical protein
MALGLRRLCEALDGLGAAAPHEAGVGEQARAERDHDEDEHRRQERLPRHDQIGDAEQEPGERGEGEHEDEVVHRDLNQGVVGVAVGEVAPDEDHRGAGRDAEQDHAGDVLLGVFGPDEVREDVLEEEHAERRHREGLDEPVDHKGQRQPPRPLADLPQARRLHLEHHREDHQPDEQRHHEVHARPLEPRHGGEELGQGVAQAHTRRDGQRHPQRQEPLEHTHGRHRLVNRQSTIVLASEAPARRGSCAAPPGRTFREPNTQPDLAPPRDARR